jgi:excisionase family DNA binding protein
MVSKNVQESLGENLVSIPELAEFLGCSNSKIYMLIRENRIPSYKVEGTRRFDPADVRVYLLGRRSGD